MKHYKIIEAGGTQFNIKKSHDSEGYLVVIEFFYNGQEYQVNNRCTSERHREKTFNSIDEDDCLEWYSQYTATGKN